MEKLYVGLDIGSSSVGWAVTDDDYNIKRLRGEKAWGSRIFSESKSKADTRMFRSNRRRIARRKYRIQLLQELFAEEIAKVDKSFFARLDNSMYHLEDKPSAGLGKNLIFKSKEEEKEFYGKYPTIWHLRKALVAGDYDAISNIKNIYLAIHHIIKYRGNFLLEGTFSSGNLDESLLDDLNTFLKNKYFTKCDCEIDGDFITKDSTEALKAILLNNNFKKTSKQKSIIELFLIKNDSTNEYIKMFATIVTGGTYKISKLDESLKEAEDSISFEGNFDENRDKIAATMQEDIEIVDIAKRMYDFVVLNDLLGTEINISNVMCNVYEEHKKDLTKLKSLIIDIDLNRNDGNRIYDVVFKDKNANNYANLVGVNSNNKRIKPEDFNLFIIKVLKDNKQFVSESKIESYNYLLQKATDKKLLKLIAHYSTSVIPHQLHLQELEKIIDNAINFYPFLKEIKQKLILLFKYRIHYSYGPLNDKSQYSNVQRKSYERITPWNISEIIDDNVTKQKFMKKLTNSCSYLLGEKVMPKVALTFEKYVILDKLNVMKVNGETLSILEKEEVVNYILSRPKTTLSQLKRFLANKFGVKINDILISNIKEDVIFEATSHAHLAKCFDLKDDKVEYYIYLATVYADDKKALKETLLNDFNELNEAQVKCILTLPTKKWAPISMALLKNVIYENEETGEQVSILGLMETTNNNFQMALFNPDYRFIDLIDEINKEKRGDVSPEKMIQEMLDETPSLFRRSIHQTMLILNDIEKAAKRQPDKIFVEVTRENDEKKKGKESTSREKEVNDFIASLTKDSQTKECASRLKEDIETLEKTRLKNKHIYLYFKQMGRDIYTGKPINIDDVIHSNKYDIDHIIPQSLIKDDSIDNMVLVDREYNQKVKGDKYPIPTEIRNENNIRLWRLLKDKNAISEKKFSNLMRASEISIEEIENFVARQINVVNYSNIVVKNILEIKYPNAKVVFSKAQYPSEVRKHLEIAKNRDINDTHHAVDAYLNIFCGNVLSTKYSDVRKIYAEKHEGEKRSFNMVGTLKNMLDKQKDKKDILYKDKIKSTCLRRDILVTFKVDYNNGAFYNATIEKASNSSALNAIHSNSPMAKTEKYGGYSGLSQSYLMAVQFEEKGKTKKYLLRVPTIYDKTCKTEEELLRKVVKNPDATNVKLIRKIHLNQKIRWKGCEYLLYTSNEKQNKYKMAYQNYIDNDYLNYLNKTNKYIEQKVIDDSLDYQEIIKNKDGKVFIVSKQKNIEIFNSLISVANKKVYDSCNYIVKLRELDQIIFYSLSLISQIKCLINFVLCLSRKSEQTNFIKELCGPTACKLCLSTNITGENITLIYESATGLFSHEVEI